MKTSRHPANARRAATALLVVAVAATTAVPARSQPASPQRCDPVATGAANATGQRPAFAQQTRACTPASPSAPVDVAVVARGLAHPWAVEPLPDGALLVTERPGRLRVVAADGSVSPPVQGLPPVDAGGQGGLLDVALSPSFASDRTVYWSYTEPRDGDRNATSVARGVLSADRRRLDEVRVILRTQPAHDGRLHFGSRLAFGPDGLLYVTLGERSDRSMRGQAQQLDSHLGKVLRIAPDGSVPSDNPFVDRPGAKPEIWTLGHRNVQAAAFDAQGRLWVVEHGARGGDEVNRLDKGANHGWPLVAYGVEYSGRPIGDGDTRAPDVVQPVYYWDPVIAPSGAQWVGGDAFPAWRGDLLVGGLKARALVRLVVDGDRVVAEEHLLTDRGQRIRDVRQAPDGALFVVTDAADGEVWRITPRGGATR